MTCSNVNKMVPQGYTSNINKIMQSYMIRLSKVLFITLFLGLLMAAMPSGSAEDFTIGVSASWNNVNGGASTPSCYQTSTTWNSVSGAYASYGWPPNSNGQCGNQNCPSNLNLNTQSGFGFVPATVGTVSNDVAFKLGQFTHYNHPVCADTGLTQIDLLITLNINGVNVPFTYTMYLDETPNTGTCTACAYSPCSFPCPDKASWGNLGSSVFTVNGVKYTLDLLGFSTGCGATPGDIITYFVSQENAANSACLYGKIVACTDVVITNPSPLTTCVGSTAIFSVEGPGISYQWYKVGTPNVKLTDGTLSGVTISGSTTSTLTITGIASSTAGSYYVQVTGACGVVVTTASALLTIVPASAITTQPSSQTVCAGGSVTFNVVATGSGTLTYQWKQSTDGGTTWSVITGQTGASLTLTGVTYSMNSYHYQVVVTGSYCGVTSNGNAILTVNNGPIVNAGSDQTVCENVAVSLIGTNTGQITGVTYLWTTSGTGTFSPSPATSLSEQYTPSTADIAAGSRTFTLTATGTSGSCRTSADSMVVYFQKNPVLANLADQTVCENVGTITLTGINNGGPATYLWTTASGTGSFSPSPATSLSEQYTPSTADIAAGSRTFTLTATGTNPCSGTSTKTMTVNFKKNPVLANLADQTVCENAGTITLTGINNGAPATYLWTTASGTGTFSPSPATLLIEQYSIGASDISAGSVMFTLTATGTSPCSGTSMKQMTLKIVLIPVASITVTSPT